MNQPFPEIIEASSTVEGRKMFMKYNDLSKIFIEDGEVFLNLETIYNYFDCERGGIGDNRSNLLGSKYYSIIGETKNELMENKDKFPTKPCIVKSDGGKLKLFIPFCELIPILGNV